MKSNSNKILSVTEIHRLISNLIRDNFTFPIVIEGEITSFRGGNSSGHYYFALKDDFNSINCVLFKGNSFNSDILPEMGKKVRITGKIETYSNPSSPSKYQIIVSNIEEIGLGKLYERYLKLKKKLYEEGLFDENNKNKKLYLFPKKIGVITAETGSIIHDIIKTIKIRFPKIEILLYPSKVQGEGAVEEILNGLKYFENREDIHSIILGRGGGSFEDLFIYNDERLIRFIYSMKTQVISSIGHETDITLCDLVSDFKASTPTQAAMLITPKKYEELDLSLKDYKKNLFNLFNSFIERKFQDLDYYFDSIFKNYKNNIRKKEINLNNLAKQIELLSFNSILEKGFSMTLNGKGEIISSIKLINKDDEIITKLKDGEIISNIKNIKKTK